ncbi:MAG: DUF3786 domain-containing protein [Bacillota bacterium]
MTFPYMTGKGQWGAYARARDFSLKSFASGDTGKMANNSGTYFDPVKSAFIVRSFGQELSVSYPEGNVLFNGTDKTPPFSWSLCLLNYLFRADGAALTQDIISYRELENGHVYYAAFRREAINMLSSWLNGKDSELIAAAVKDLGGVIDGGADLACTIYAFPRFPVYLKLWFPDEEMDGSANILFNSSANHYQHTEDIAAIGELTAYFLVSQYNLLVTGKQSIQNKY